MLPRNLDGSRDSTQPAGWVELGQGIPTLMAFAQLASRALSHPVGDATSLSRHAKALLVAARQFGTFELRGNTESFQSADRLLAVCVETEDQQYLVFKQPSSPRRTMEFLEGFRQLCAAGFVIHQSHREFAMSADGFAVADSLNSADYSEELSFGRVPEA